MKIRSKKDNFEVKRSSKQIFFKAILCFIWGILISITFAEYMLVHFLIIFFCICFVIYLTAKKDKNATLFIEVDKQGIWIENQLLTDWGNYIKSYILKDFEDASAFKKLEINIEYYKTGESGFFLNKLHFNGSEDKSEYEVLEAIEKFYNHNT